MIFRRLVFLGIAVLFLLKKASAVLNVLTTGTNHVDHTDIKNTKKNSKNIIHPYPKTIHAEETAINKIQINKNRKKIEVSLLVIRITPSSTIDNYRLTNSKPCVSCISKIRNIEQIGYKITKIYFSDEQGDIICYKLRDILTEKQYLTKYYRRTNIPKNLLKFDIVNK